MRTLDLPQTDLRVSALGFGVAMFGTEARGAEADRLLTTYIEAGGNFVDTAHCYAFWLEGGLGASERELGACLRRIGARAEVVVATKGGHPDGGPAYPRPDAYLAPERIARDVEESLERLGLPRVDLYYLHRDDARVPVAEIVDALNVEVRAGRIGALGASNWATERIAEANADAALRGLRGFCCSQVQWSLAVPTWAPGADPTVRFVTDEDRAWHEATGVPIVAYSATANGYFARTDAGPESFRLPANEARRARARSLAEELGVTPTQVALGWLLAQAAPTVALFSTTKRAHLIEALEASAIELTPEQARWLREG